MLITTWTPVLRLCTVSQDPWKSTTLPYATSCCVSAQIATARLRTNTTAVAREAKSRLRLHPPFQLCCCSGATAGFSSIRCVEWEDPSTGWCPTVAIAEVKEDTRPSRRTVSLSEHPGDGGSACTFSTRFETPQRILRHSRSTVLATVTMHY